MQSPIQPRILLEKRSFARYGFLVLLCFAIGLHSDSLKEWQNQMAVTRQQSMLSMNAKTQERQRAKDLKAQSEIAMMRVEQGCEPVQLSSNDQEARFDLAMRVFDSATFPKNPRVPRFDKYGNPINGVRPLPNGIRVCTRFGDTGIVGNNGFVNDIARVEESRLQEFLTHFNKYKQRWQQR